MKFPSNSKNGRFKQRFIARPWRRCSALHLPAEPPAPSPILLQDLSCIRLLYTKGLYTFHLLRVLFTDFVHMSDPFRLLHNTPYHLYWHSPSDIQVVYMPLLGLPQSSDAIGPRYSLHRTLGCTSCTDSVPFQLLNTKHQGIGKQMSRNSRARS